jgi:hypothetical protein
MLSRVSCAKAASESTACDIFIFPKQWKYRTISSASQMFTTKYGQKLFIRVAILVLAAVLLSCNSRNATDQEFRQEVEALEKRTTPPDATVVFQSGLTRTDIGVTASWDIETTMDEAEYTNWLSAQLQPEFKPRKTTESHLVFSKHQNGDVHSVECSVATHEGKLHIHVTFSAIPD